MILRVLAVFGGLAFAAASSQFPEFSQQYVQRLGGAVDALGEVVADFDASAAATGHTRQTALEALQGTDFLDRRRTDMERTITRYDKLRRDLARIEGAGPFMRAYFASSFRDSDVGRATLGAYAPAVPLNASGLIFAGLGFLLGLICVVILWRVVVWPIRAIAKRTPA